MRLRILSSAISMFSRKINRLLRVKISVISKSELPDQATLFCTKQKVSHRLLAGFIPLKPSIVANNKGSVSTKQEKDERVRA